MKALGPGDTAPGLPEGGARGPQEEQRDPPHPEVTPSLGQGPLRFADPPGRNEEAGQEQTHVPRRPADPAGGADPCAGRGPGLGAHVVRSLECGAGVRLPRRAEQEGRGGQGVPAAAQV